MNSNEWHLDTSIAAGGRSKILQLVLYVSQPLSLLKILWLVKHLLNVTVVKLFLLACRYIPSAKECPLNLQLPNGEISKANGYISPVSCEAFEFFVLSVLVSFFNGFVWCLVYTNLTDVGRCSCLESYELFSGSRKVPCMAQNFSSGIEFYLEGIIPSFFVGILKDMKFNSDTRVQEVQLKLLLGVHCPSFF